MDESAISDTVRMLDSMAAICYVFQQLATQGVEILFGYILGKLAVGAIYQTKITADTRKLNAYFEVK